MMDSIKPTGILSKYIQNYFIVETCHSMDFLPKERVYPTGNATMVFHYGDPSKFQKLKSPETIEPNLVICGQQTNYYDLSLSGKTGMILIVFKPHGVKSFFNFPMTELSDENLSLQGLVNNEADELEDKLLNARDKKQNINGRTTKTQYKTLGLRWLNQALYPASVPKAFGMSADRVEARKSQHFTHVTVSGNADEMTKKT